MITSMNKKTLIISIVVIVLLAAFCFSLYAYINQPSDDQVQKDNTNVPLVEVKAEPGSNNSAGILTVCVDECGSGVCQNGESACNDLSCVCMESKKECPQDCPY